MRRQSRFPFKKPSRRFDFGYKDPQNIIRVVERQVKIESVGVGHIVLMSIRCTPPFSVVQLHDFFSKMADPINLILSVSRT